MPRSPEVAMALVLVGWCASGVLADVIPPESEITFHVTGLGGEASGRILNRTQSAGTVDISLLPVDGATSVAPGFELIDTTMLQVLSTDLGAGAIRARLRKTATREILAAAREKGYRARNLLLMMQRPERRTGRLTWRPCARVLESRNIDARRRVGRATFVLGDYGVCENPPYVWAVMDLPGRYAIGVPEPATAGCLIAGGVALLLRRRSG